MRPSQTLSDAIRRRAVVGIERRRIDANTLYGFPLAVGRSLLLLQEEDDFALEGLVLLRLRDLTRVSRQSFTTRVFRDEGTRPVRAPLRPAALDSWSHALQALQRRDELLIVETESLDEETESFSIGRVLDARPRSELLFHHFDGEGRWEDEPRRLRLSDITCVQFSSRYIDVFRRYLPVPAK